MNNVHRNSAYKSGRNEQLLSIKTIKTKCKDQFIF